MPRNILISDATSKTALLLTQDLPGPGHKVTVQIRNSSDTSTLPEGTDMRRGDMTDLQVGVCDSADMRFVPQAKVKRPVRR